MEIPENLPSTIWAVAFDLETLVRWIKDIRPEIVEVGADNYHNNLPEPPWEKGELTHQDSGLPPIPEKDDDF